MISPSSSSSSKLLQFIHWVEDGLLGLLLLAMVVLAATQILLRNTVDTSILWADPALRILVLWVSLVGAMVATRYDHHIAIEAVTRNLPHRAQLAVRVLVDLFTAIVALVVAWHGGRLVMDEYAFGTLAFGVVPVWLCQTIIPIAFAIISLRYFLFFAQHGKRLLSGRSEA